MRDLRAVPVHGGGRSAILLATFLASAAAAAAQTAPPAESAPILVEGTRNRDQQISDFIRDLTPAPVRGQLGRFETAACPAAIGLPDRQNALIAERMRRVAQAAAIPLARPGCKPNVILIVTNNKAAFLAQLAKHRPDYFPEEWASWHIREVQRDPSPVAAWQLETPMRADGRTAPQGSSASSSESGGDLLANAGRTTEMASRLRPLGRKAFFASVVLVQASALAGLTTTQLADYAAMRAFVRTDPKEIRHGAAETILGVIDAPMGSAVPLTLTAWDLSFLKAFYASGKDSYAEYQRSEMRRLMSRSLDKPKP